MATIKSIAELTGFSRVTVSAVLHAKPGVSEQTRKKVLEAIREHNLHHRLIARNLMGHFYQMFGVVVPDIANPFYTELIDGFMAEIKDGDNHMICQPTRQSHALEVRTLETLLEYNLAGFVLGPTHQHKSVEHVQKVLATGRPLVTIGPLPGVDTHTVDFEDREGSKKATEYLIRHGHERIVFLAGVMSSPAGKDRALGFMEALLEHHVPFDNSMVAIRTDGSWESGYQAALDVLKNRQPKPTALLCFNDVVAMGAYRAAHELGLHIPTDISIVGFDNIRMSAVLGPPLTTVSIFPDRIGRAAAKILLDVLLGNGRDRVRHETIHTELVERGSVKTL
ncbi:MAG: LacI family DNA-binding transcriptional regulator [Candidatus Hydrogenedentota bacterium]